MNERIKELMKEANKDIPLGKPFWPALEEFSEKFAELIVKENIDLLRKEWYTLNNQKAPTYETPREVGIRLGMKTEIISLIHKIKEHFGVEE